MLCEAYWLPLYAFARRGGAGDADAQDMVQGFFAKLLEKGWLSQADEARGRFRTFLLAAFRHHMSHEREHAGAKKRGGDVARFSLDAARLAGFEFEGDDEPEAMFERVWAHALLDRAQARLAARYHAKGGEAVERFAALSPLLGGGPKRPYREIGLRLGLSETAVKVAAHRMRQRLGRAIREEIAETLAEPTPIAIEAEIVRLREALQ